MQESLNQRLVFDLYTLVAQCSFLLQHDAQTENTSSSYRQKPLIYADLGTAPGKRPMAAPLSTHDHVVYSTVNSNID